MLFLLLDLVAYSTGFIRQNLPSELSTLNFLSFLYNQFTSIHFISLRYVGYLTLGVIFAITLSYLITKIAFNYGKSRIEK